MGDSHETFGYGKAVFNMKAFKEVLTFVTLFSAVLGNGEFTIHHSPNGINFKGNEPIDSSELPNILTTAMGISSNSDNTWEGLTIQKLLNSLKQKVEKKVDTDGIWIQLKGLNNIMKNFGQQSEQTVEAVSILNNALEQLEDSLEKVYGEKFLLTSITEDNHHSRHTRAADKPGDEPKPPKIKNLSKRYGEDYSAIFNIILFTSIFLIAALITTSVFICTLD